MSQIVVYTKDACPSCNKAKALLALKGKTYTEVNVGQDIIREQFMNLFPNVKTVPFIIIDGVQIGGYDKLAEYFDNSSRQYLTEGSAG